MAPGALGRRPPLPGRWTLGSSATSAAGRAAHSAAPSRRLRVIQPSRSAWVRTWIQESRAERRARTLLELYGVSHGGRHRQLSRSHHNGLSRRVGRSPCLSGVGSKSGRRQHVSFMPHRPGVRPSTFAYLCWDRHCWWQQKGQQAATVVLADTRIPLPVRYLHCGCHCLPTSSYCLRLRPSFSSSWPLLRPVASYRLRPAGANYRLRPAASCLPPQILARKVLARMFEFGATIAPLTMCRPTTHSGCRRTKL